MESLIFALIKILFALAMGFAAYKMHVLNDTNCKAVSKFVLNFILPCLVFTSMTSIGQGEGDIVIILVVSSTIAIGIALVVGWLTAKILRMKQGSIGVTECCIMFGNIIFIGIPIANGIFGEIGSLYIFILNISFTVLVYSLGMFLVCRDGSENFKFSIKSILSPGFIAGILGLICYLIGFSLPTQINDCLSFVGNIASPLSLIVVGATIAASPLKEVFVNWKYYVISLVKLIILPLIIFFLMKIFVSNRDLCIAVSLYMGFPSAVVIGMFALNYDGNEKMTTAIITMTSILCLATLPIIYAIMRAV